MKVLTGTLDDLLSILNQFNAKYDFPNPMTKTESYSKIEYISANESAMSILDQDVEFVELNYPNVKINPVGDLNKDN
jgi:hypothetical protein